VRGSVSSAGVKVAAVAVGFGFHLLAARLLHETSYGIFTYVFTWTMLVAMASQLGFVNAVVRYVASYDAQREWALLRGIRRHAEKLALATSVLVIGVGLAAVAELLHARVEMRSAFQVGLLCVPVLVLLSLREAAIRAFRQPALGSISATLVRPLVTGTVLLAAAWTMGRDLDARVAMQATFLGALAALVVATLLLRSVQPQEARGVAPDTAPRANWTWVALPLMLTMVMNMVSRRADVLMLGALVPAREVGYYAAAARYSDFVIFVQQAANSMAAPLFAGLHAQGKLADIQRVASLAAAGTLACALPIAAVLLFFGDALLRLFGPGFVAAMPALRWLVVGQLFNAGVGSVGILMVMLGQHRTAALVATGIASLNIALNAVLIPVAGIEGAGMATATSLVTLNLVTLVIVRRRLGIDATVFGLLRRRVGHSDSRRSR